jgi:hypothetical protein
LIISDIFQLGVALAVLACGIMAWRILGWALKVAAAITIVGALCLLLSIPLPWVLLPGSVITLISGFILIMGLAWARRWRHCVILASALAAVLSLLAFRQQAVWDGLFKLMEPKACASSPLPAKTVSQLPFDNSDLVEAIAVLDNGAFVISVASRGELWKVSRAGLATKWATLPAGKFDATNFNGMTGGVVQGGDGAVYALLLAREDQFRGLWRLDLKTGSQQLWAPFPAHAQPNGVALASNGDFFVSDSSRGSIWHVKAGGGAAREWLRDKMLGAGAWLPMPTANGIKIKGQNIFVSNSLQKKVIHVKILPNHEPGQVRVIDEGIAADDFDVSSKGDIFLTTHPFNSVIRLSGGRSCATVASLNENIVGPTAAMFGRGPEDSEILYVVTDGGFSRPHPGGRPAIVAIDTAGTTR